MHSHQVVFLVEVLVTVVFDAVDRDLTRRSGSRTGSEGLSSGVDEEEELLDLSSYHPVFQELHELKRQLSVLSPSADFVQHSRLGRKAVRVEKEWKEVQKNMEPQERVRHDNAFKPSTPAAPISKALNVPKVQGHRRWLPSVRVVVLWIFAHLIFGWSRKLKTMPLFSLPSAVFWPVMNSQSGKVYFPVSWILNKIDFDDVALGDAVLQSASVPPIPGGGVLTSLGFATTIYVLNRGYCRLLAGVKNLKKAGEKLPVKQQ